MLSLGHATDAELMARFSEIRDQVAIDAVHAKPSC